MAVDDAEVGRWGLAKKNPKKHFNGGNFGGGKCLFRGKYDATVTGYYPYLYPMSILLLECRNQREFQS